MKPITKFNSWVLNKAARHLVSSEGMDLIAFEYTEEGAVAIVQDAFGYRYELNIKTVARVITDPDGVTWGATSALSSASILEKL